MKVFAFVKIAQNQLRPVSLHEIVVSDTAFDQHYHQQHPARTEYYM